MCHIGKDFWKFCALGFLCSKGWDAGFEWQGNEQIAEECSHQSRLSQDSESIWESKYSFRASNLMVVHLREDCISALEALNKQGWRLLPAASAPYTNSALCAHQHCCSNFDVRESCFCTVYLAGRQGIETGGVSILLAKAHFRQMVENTQWLEFQRN